MHKYKVRVYYTSVAIRTIEAKNQQELGKLIDKQFTPASNDSKEVNYFELIEEETVEEKVEEIDPQDTTLF